jgi:enamidase
MTTVAIKNIGTLVTGDIKNPISSANTIIIEDGVIAKLGNEELLNQYKCDMTIDAKGITVTPGLIDSHVHPVIGDFTPRQNTLGFINSSFTVE